MIIPSHAELLTILSNAPNSGLSTAEIFKIACDSKNTQIPDPESVSKMLYTVRGKKLITTSDGKVRMHKITQKGIAALDEFNGVTIQEEPKLELIETNGKEATMTADNLLEGSQVEPPFLLDPANEQDAQFISIITALREAQNRPKPFKIERKEEKVVTLLRLGALMSDDIKIIFDDIIADLGSI